MTKCPNDCNKDQLIGVEVRGLYDGVCYWTCRKCGARWHRFPAGDYRRERVEKIRAALGEEQ